MAVAGKKAPLSASAVVLRLAVIGVVVGVTAAAFAYAGGAFSPERITRENFVSVFKAGGAQPGFRFNHAKGMCVTGTFESNGAAAALSAASLFAPGQVPLVGRISLAGPPPFQPDTADQIRSMALRLMPADGQEWRTAMIAIPVFLASTADGFHDLLVATAPDPKTGKPNPKIAGAFFAKHPESAAAIARLKTQTPTSGFDDATYRSLDTFVFRNAAGQDVRVRWAVVPVTTPAAAPPPATPASAAAAPPGPNYLFEALIGQIARHPLQWRLMVTVANARDPSDPTQAWPASRRQVDAGMITLDHAASEDGGACTNITYDPMVLPAGIEASDDPIPAARSAVYARSFELRARDAAEKKPSAITPADVQEKKS